MGLYLRSVEMVVVMLFGLVLIAAISADDLLKALIAGFFGLLIGVIGTDHIYNTPRATFGFLELFDGVPLVPALIGLFAISEALVILEQETVVDKDAVARQKESHWQDTIEGLRISLANWWHITWTGIVGLVIGIVPGAGASIAAFVAYQQSRVFSKTPELYGTGHPQGVIAPESANNGVTSGTLVPLMAIGVPGGSTAAVMMIVLQYHGIVLGPRLFIDSPNLAYGVFISMMVSYIFMIFTIIPLARYMSQVVLIPTRYLVPLIVSLTTIGAFANREYIFDMGLAILFGVLGYIARKTNYHVTAILIGVILGPLFEQYLLRALRIGQGDLMILFSSTIGNVLWGLLALSILIPLWRSARNSTS
jgi:putative tricarboxylic transport membrane protein